MPQSTAGAACLNLTRDVTRYRPTLQLSVFTSTVSMLAVVFILVGGENLSHRHFRVTSLGVLSNMASYNTIFTRMHVVHDVCCSALGRITTSCVLHHRSFWSMSLVAL